MQRYLTYAVLLTVFTLQGCSQFTGDDAPTHFVTWQGIGPDKWASIWLIKRHINPKASIQFIPVDAAPVAGVSFDIPGSAYYRSKTTTFEQMIQANGLTSNAALETMIDIVHDIEITPWGGLRNESSQSVEIAFRGLQQKYGRESVSEACYLALFDSVYSVLDEKIPIIETKTITPDPSCQEHLAENTSPPAIPLMEIRDVLVAMQKGKRVVFLDAREKEEYLEGHIPGAINVKLRDIDHAVAEQYIDADIIVPYCVKDFRGYEVARTLSKHGIQNTVIMQPFGLKGWSSLNLPLQGHLKLSESEAEKAMTACINAPEKCLEAI